MTNEPDQRARFRASLDQRSGLLELSVNANVLSRAASEYAATIDVANAYDGRVPAYLLDIRRRALLDAISRLCAAMEPFVDDNTAPNLPKVVPHAP